MTNSRFVACIAAVIVGTVAVSAQYDRRLPASSCEMQSDTSVCFAGSGEARVSREVLTLRSLYRLCLGVDTSHAQARPLRLVLAIDRTGSMCNDEPHEHNDVEDKRILASHLFVDSLARRNPHSEVGTLLFNDNIRLTPRSLSSDDALEDIHEEISDGACRDNYSYPKRLKALETFIGSALSAALDLVDRDYSRIGDTHARHIIILTDGQWDDKNETGPAELLQEYREDHPGRTLPSIHAVFLSDSAWHVNRGEPAFPFGVELEQVVSATGGVFIENAQPHNVVERLLGLLETISAVTPETPLSVSVEHIESGRSSSAGLSALAGGAGNHWVASADPFVLDTGRNTFVMATKTTLGERVDTFTVHRSPTLSSSSAPGFAINCGIDTIGLDIDAGARALAPGDAVDIIAEIDPADQHAFIPGDIIARVCTPASLSSAGLIIRGDGALKAGGGVSVLEEVRYADGVFGQAIRGGKLALSPGALGDNVTLSAWVKLDRGARETVLFGGQDWAMGVHGGHLYLASGADTLRSPGQIDVEVWQHIALAREGGQARMYINGMAESGAVAFGNVVFDNLEAGPVDGYLIDEIRISPEVRREQLGSVQLLAIPAATSVRWEYNQAPASGQPAWRMPADMWLSGRAQFAYAVDNADQTVVQLVRTGDDGIAWSKMGEPVDFSRATAPATAALFDRDGDGYLDRIDIMLIPDTLALKAEIPPVDDLVDYLSITVDAGERALHAESIERAGERVMRITLTQNSDGVLETGWRDAAVDLSSVAVTTDDQPATVIDVLDKAGPVVADAVHFADISGQENDTIAVSFSEPVACEQLRSVAPGDAFTYYSGSNASDLILRDATYDRACERQFVTVVRIVVSGQGSAINPDLDSIQVRDGARDAADNGPAADSRKARIRSNGVMRVNAVASPSPYVPGESTISESLSPRVRRFYGAVIEGREHGVLIAITTSRPLRPGQADIYGSADMYDAVGNLVIRNLFVKRSGDSHRDYGIFWDGANQFGRKVGPGAYLCIMRLVDIDGNATVKRVKIGVAAR
jgi:hypothetical protein